jgi:hypothetical protein
LPLFETISVPPFHAILIEDWNAPPHRYFIAYRILGDFRHVIGLPVIDEFATFSTPIFFGPKKYLGELYNVGITLGHQRDPEMGIDQGWPPVCAGIDTEETAPFGWQEQLLNAIKQRRTAMPPKEEEFAIKNVKISAQVNIYATNAPLLPRQLKRLCQIGDARLSFAFATGNRIAGQNGKLLTVNVASETTFEQLFHRFSTPFSGR